MHSTLVRLQNVFGFFTTVTAVVGALIALSVVITPQEPTATIHLRSAQVVRGRPHYYSTKKEEYAHLKFDVEADLSSLMTWNTKQIYLYIAATYPSPSPLTTANTTSIIWDAILPHPLSAPSHPNTFTQPTLHYPAHPSDTPSRPGHIKLRGQRPKYQITDISGKIAERGNVTLEVGWNVQPWVGALTWTNRVDWGFWKGLRGGRSKEFRMPSVSGRKGEGKGGANGKGGAEAPVKGAEKNRGAPA